MKISNKILSKLYSNEITTLLCDCVITDNNNKILMSGKAVMSKDSDNIGITGKLEYCEIESSRNYKTIKILKTESVYKCTLSNLFPKNTKYLNDVKIEFPNIYINSQFNFNTATYEFSGKMCPMFTSNCELFKLVTK